MDVGQWSQLIGSLRSPWLVAAVVFLATFFIWMAFVPSRAKEAVQKRVDGYLDRSAFLADDMDKPFVVRVLLPLLRAAVRAFGRVAPRGSVDQMERKLVQAGRPLGMAALDFYGLRLLFMAVLAGGYYLLLARDLDLLTALRNTLALVALGYFLPTFWLTMRVRGRKNRILRALPDALDMLTIGVEAGLAFESALLRVGDQWDNPLTREFRRSVMEMRVGAARDEALKRMAERTGVSELNTFVAILVQSSALGVSIAQVLHTQAATMRTRRRQRAEELARQAGIKMVIPLAFFVFPAILVVILGPSIPAFLAFFRTIGGTGGLGF